MNPAADATQLAQQAERLTQQGKLPEALQTTQRAVALFAEADQATPEFARTLHWLGVRLAMLGRPDEALPRCREGLEMRRQIAAEHPEQAGQVLADALHNACILLSAVGDPTEALGVAEESVALSRQAGTAGAALANALNTLALRLHAVARSDDALVTNDEAATLLAGAPVELGRTLAIRHAVLAGMGQQDEAIDAARAALEALEPHMEESGLARGLANRLLGDLAPGTEGPVFDRVTKALAAPR